MCFLKDINNFYCYNKLFYIFIILSYIVGVDSMYVIKKDFRVWKSRVLSKGDIEGKIEWFQEHKLLIYAFTL